MTPNPNYAKELLVKACNAREQRMRRVLNTFKINFVDKLVNAEQHHAESGELDVDFHPNSPMERDIVESYLASQGFEFADSKLSNKVRLDTSCEDFGVWRRSVGYDFWKVYQLGKKRQVKYTKKTFLKLVEAHDFTRESYTEVPVAYAVYKCWQARHEIVQYFQAHGFEIIESQGDSWKDGMMKITPRYYTEIYTTEVNKIANPKRQRVDSEEGDESEEGEEEESEEDEE